MWLVNICLLGGVNHCQNASDGIVSRMRLIVTCLAANYEFAVQMTKLYTFCVFLDGIYICCNMNLWSQIQVNLSAEKVENIDLAN